MNQYINKKRTEIKQIWGQWPAKARDMELISLLFKKTKYNFSCVVSDRTWNDLGMDSVYEMVDHTQSSIGEQKLYQVLHTQKQKINELKILENRIEYFEKHRKERYKTQSELKKLNKTSLYFFHELFTEIIPKKPKIFIIYPVLLIITLASILFCILKPQLILFVVIISFFNVCLHYINKGRIGTYIDSLYNITLIIKATKKINKEDLPFIDTFSLNRHIAKCSKITKLTKWLSFDFNESNDFIMISHMVLELVKGIFLLEILLFYQGLNRIRNNSDSIKYLFDTMGDLDVAISIGSYRMSQNTYCKPIFLESSLHMSLVNLKHPLVENCTSNSIMLEDKSILITGSNMAGKSTFIRAVGINCILSQSIYTALCTSYRAPFLKVLSSINISDNITEGRSYFLEEIVTIKDLILNANSKETCLFIIDEIFKGTNTFDRIAAAKAVLSFLAKGNIVFVSTHDIELTDLLTDKYDLFFFQDLIHDKELIFNYKLNKGKPSKSNAIRLLELNGFPPEIIQEACNFKKGKMQ